MAIQKIPLNKFVSEVVKITKSPNLSSVYIAKDLRTSIVVGAIACNETNELKLIDVVIEHYNVYKSTQETYFYLKSFPIKPLETKNLITGRLILQGKDFSSVLLPEKLYLKDCSETQTLTGLSVSFNILESNTEPTVIRELPNIILPTYTPTPTPLIAPTVTPTITPPIALTPTPTTTPAPTFTVTPSPTPPISFSLTPTNTPTPTPT